MGLEIPAELVRTVLQDLEEGLIYCDLEGRVLDINRGAELILGLDPAGGRVSGESLRKAGILRREDLKPVAAGLKILNAPAVVRHPGGRERKMLISAFPVTGEGGGVEGMLLSIKPALPRPDSSGEGWMAWISAYLAQITDNLREGVGYTDMEGRILFANPAFEGIVGISASELKDRPLPSCVKPVGRPLLFLEVLESTTRQEHWEGELEITVGGERKSLLITSALVREPGGKPSGVSLIMRDITARKRLEEEMEESRRELGVIYGMLRVTSDLYDLEGSMSETLNHILFAMHAEAGAVLVWDRAETGLRVRSAAGFTYRGAHALEEEGERGRPLFKVFEENQPWLVEDAAAGRGGPVAEGKRGRLRSLLAAPIQSGRATLGVIVLAHKDPGIFSLRQAERLTSMASRMGVIYEMARTVNSLQEKVEELGLEREFNQAMLECVPAMVFLMDGEGRVASANRRARETLGYPEERLEGRAFARLVCTRDRGEWRHYAGKAAEGEAGALEARLLDGGGNEVRVEIRCSPVGSPATGGEGLLVVAMPL